jgi:FtsH-binding integral membrane protein
MNKINDKSVRAYRLLLNLYPMLYLKEYRKPMEQTFTDMLKDNSIFKVWSRVAKELFSSLVSEHIENIKGGKMKVKDKKRLIIAILISIACGIIGFFLSFLIGEGLAEVSIGEMPIPLMFIGIAIYNFIICLFIGRFYPKSVWFAGLFINIVVWAVLIGNLNGPGGFIDLWYGWLALIIFAFGGSLIGSIILRKKQIQLYNAQKE